MFNLKKLFSEKTSETELQSINEEINRSKRYGFNFGILVVELTHAAPYGLSKLMPGKTISYKILKQNLRCYDKIVGPFIRRYYILLPQTDKEGVEVVNQRIHKVAKDKNLGEVYIGKAIFPFDGKDAKSLLKRALGK